MNLWVELGLFAVVLAFFWVSLRASKQLPEESAREPEGLPPAFQAEVNNIRWLLEQVDELARKLAEAERNIHLLGDTWAKEVEYVKGTWKKVRAAERNIEKREAEERGEFDVPGGHAPGSGGEGVHAMSDGLEDDDAEAAIMDQARALFLSGGRG